MRALPERLLRATFCAAILSAFSPARASAPYVQDCSASLKAHWSDEVAAHPVDPDRHVLAVFIDIPVHSPKRRYAQAVAALKERFPSFIEGPSSGLLTGCCAVPVFGSLSVEEFSRLSDAGFAPLCGIGRRFRSSAVGLRAEQRETYRTGGGEAYLLVYWHRKPVPNA